MDLTEYKVELLSDSELLETDGGFLPLLLIGAALLLAGCQNGSGNTQQSTVNGNNSSVNISASKGDTIVRVNDSTWVVK